MGGVAHFDPFQTSTKVPKGRAQTAILRSDPSDLDDEESAKPTAISWITSAGRNTRALTSMPATAGTPPGSLSAPPYMLLVRAATTKPPKAMHPSNEANLRRSDRLGPGHHASPTVSNPSMVFTEICQTT